MDLSLGSRFLGKAHNIPFSRKFLLRVGILFTQIFSGIKVMDVHNGIRAFSRKAALAIHIRMDRMGHASEILDQAHQAGFGAFVWLAATVAILKPELTIRVAGFLGIGRGADLVLYFLVITYLISIFYIYQRFQKLESKISELVRYIALQSVLEPPTRDDKIRQENFDIK